MKMQTWSFHQTVEESLLSLYGQRRCGSLKVTQLHPWEKPTLRKYSFSFIFRTVQHEIKIIPNAGGIFYDQWLQWWRWRLECWSFSFGVSHTKWAAWRRSAISEKMKRREEKRREDGAGGKDRMRRTNTCKCITSASDADLKLQGLWGWRSSHQCRFGHFKCRKKWLCWLSTFCQSLFFSTSLQWITQMLLARLTSPPRDCSKVWGAA